MVGVNRKTGVQDRKGDAPGCTAARTFACRGAIKTGKVRFPSQLLSAKIRGTKMDLLQRRTGSLGTQTGRRRKAQQQALVEQRSVIRPASASARTAKSLSDPNASPLTPHPVPPSSAAYAQMATSITSATPQTPSANRRCSATAPCSEPPQSTFDRTHFSTFENYTTDFQDCFAPEASSLDAHGVAR